MSTINIKNTIYKRPKKTYTEKLTPDEIENLLDDYISVDDISKVPIGSHLRYFITKNGKQQFRIGGFLKSITGLPDYILMDNKKVSWPVQMEGATFFRKMKNKEIKDEYEGQITELKNEIKKLKQLVKQLKNDNRKLYKIIKRK